MILDPAAEDARYEAAFRWWAAGVVAEWAAQYPDHPAFDLDAFDGCTYAPDDCRDCCLVHDLSCHHARTWADRLAGDRGLRACIARKGAYEGALWRWLWPLRAWTFYAGVRAWAWGNRAVATVSGRSWP